MKKIIILLFSMTLISFVHAATIYVNVHNVNSNLVQGAYVKLYDSSWNEISSSYTNSSGMVTFALLDYGTYNYEVYYFGDIQEFWGSEENISLQSPTLTSNFTRYWPYRYDYDLPPAEVYTNNEISFEVTVKNEVSFSRNVKVEIWVDRNQSSSWDFHQTSNAQSISSNSTKSFDFSFTPTYTGIYYWKAHILTWNDGAGEYIATDSYFFNLAFIAVDETGDLSITVKNVNGDNIENALVKLYEEDWDLFEEDYTNSSGEANFDNLDYGTYHYEVFYTGDVLEFWGGDDNIVVNSSSESETFNRNWPYRLGYQQPPSSVDINTPVSYRIDVKNKLSYSRNVRVEIWLDKDQSESWDFHELSDAKSIAGNSTESFTFNFTPTSSGTYYWKTYIKSWNDGADEYIVTDSYFWSEAFEVENTQEIPLNNGLISYHVYSHYLAVPSEGDAMDGNVFIYDFDENQPLNITANSIVVNAMNPHFNNSGSLLTFMGIPIEKANEIDFNEEKQYWYRLWKNLEIYTYDLSTKEIIRLTNNEIADEDSKFSPDGNRIIFKQNKDIKVMDLDGNIVEILTNNGSTPEESMPFYTKDGNQVLYVQGVDENAGIYKMNKDGSQSTVLFNEPGVFEYYPIAISNESFIYTRWINSTVKNDQLYYGDFDGTTYSLSINQLTANNSDVYPVDNDYVIFSTTRYNTNYDLALGKLSTGDVWPLSELGINSSLQELGACYVIPTSSEYYLEVSTIELNLGGEEGSNHTFNISSNISWYISESTDWFSVSQTQGTGDAEITVTTLDSNKTGSTREGLIVVNGEGVQSKEITVYQESLSTSLNAPSLALPANGSSITDQTPYFEWEIVDGATSYQLQVDNNNDFSSPELDQTLQENYYQVNNTLNYDSYNWRVKAINSTQESNWSEVWLFEIQNSVSLPAKPINPTPSDGSSNIDINSNLSWENGGGATGFNVYFGTNNTPDETEFKVSQTGTSYDLGTLLPNTHYFWRIDAVNSAGTTTGDIWDFTTNNSNNNIHSISGAIKLTDQSPLSDIIIQYGTNEILDQKQTEINWGFMVDNGLDRWQSFKPNGTSICKVRINMHITGNHPGNLILTIKDKNETIWNGEISNADVVNGWNSISMQPSIEVISGDEYFLMVRSSASSPNPDNRYYWRGQYVSDYDSGISDPDADYPGFDYTFEIYSGDLEIKTDINGFYLIYFNEGWSGQILPVYQDSWSFNPEYREYENLSTDFSNQDFEAITPPSKPINPTPSDGSSNIDINSNLSWENGGGATSYKIYFGTSNNLSENDYQGSQTETSYDPGTLNPNTHYFWRIDAFNSAGTTTGNIWNFTTENINNKIEWVESQYPLPLQPYRGFACATNDEYIYILGGDSTGAVETVMDYVIFTKINQDGSLASWSETTPLPIPLWESEAVIYQNYIFVIGGSSKGYSSKEVYRNIIQEDGTLGNWTQEASLPTSVYGHTAIINKNRIYVLGSWYSSNTFFSEIDSNGELSSWNYTTSLIENNYAGDAINFNNMIFLLGGKEIINSEQIVTSKTRYAEIREDGQLSTWNNTTDMPKELWFHQAVSDNNIIFIVGGGNSSIVKNEEVYRAVVQSDGSIDWSTVGEISDPSEGLGLIYSKNYLYYFGGAWTNHCYYANIESLTTPFYLPYKPINPTPSNGATAVDLNANLSWSNGGGATSYKIYFGTDNTPDAEEYKGEQTGTTYDPGALTANTTYYWRIDPVNSVGETRGDFWSFTSAGSLPSKPINPNPSDGAENIHVDANINWENGGGATSYKVYFDTSSTPGFKNEQTETSYEPGTLIPETEYFWRIDAVNSNGTTTGNLWSFTTAINETQSFTKISLDDISLIYGDLEWGDYDNDNDYDLIMTGNYFDNGNPIPKTVLYRNEGQYIFQEVNEGSFIDLYESSVAWGDYNNDGFLDLIFTGWAGGNNSTTTIYKNNQDGTFTEQSFLNLTGVGGGDVAWFDYNNDGFLDIIFTGHDIGLARITMIYKNNGDDTFSEYKGTSFIGLAHAYLSIGDLNNDSFQDLILTGESDTGAVTSIFLNDQENGFSNLVSNSLPNLLLSVGEYIDFNNDGYLDVFLSGLTWRNNNLDPVTGLLINNGDETFSNTTTNIQVLDANAEWGDYSNDGFSDLLFGPILYESTGTDQFNEYLNLFYEIVDKRRWIDIDNDGDLDLFAQGREGSYREASVFINNNPILNNSPNTPTNLTSQVNGDMALLSWDKATDDNTSENGLSYDLVIGSSQGSRNIKSPMANLSTGFRRVVERGSTQGNSFIIKDLKGGTYYWSVQAVDAAFAGSAFAEWQSFIINISSNEKEEKIIKEFSLSQNFPNPFNPTTKIKYDIPKESKVKLAVYDNLGREVSTLVNEQNPAGSYEVEFIASQFSSGVYFYELRAGDFRDVKKLVLLK